MIEFDENLIDWEKVDGLVPAVVQDDRTGTVLMLGYMNPQAVRKTLDCGKVTFWSRTKQRLWTKGETSQNFLELRAILPDCDRDTLLVKAHPTGPVCHTGSWSCFEDREVPAKEPFVFFLEELIRSRRRTRPKNSYTTLLFEQGLGEIAKKLGEEAIEVIVSINQSRQRTIEETADLIYHLLVFLAERDVGLEEVVEELQRRHSSAPKQPGPAADSE